MARSALASAALRHLRDAEHLAEPGGSQSLDQSFHLVGFGPECIRKACLDESLADQALGHDLKDVGDPVVEWLVACDPSAVRYGLQVDAHSLAWLRASDWKPSVRYCATGEAAKRLLQPALAAVLHEARDFVDSRMAALWGDGALEDEALT